MRDAVLVGLVPGDRDLLARDVEVDDGPLARVEIALRGSGRLVSLVTRKAIDELALDVGDDVFAMVKATALDERSMAYAPRAR
jgi:molybdopterin-binding protein